ncbi:plant glycogenin-like starch initiation protein 3 [Perilla frutescens var. hirtella]|uniref:Hexosyltransferase n=1 Tax=Perilla frutescens var. hirtella TaxID=608512 RepID=A0AAD4P7U4_PERFH|nr:plant glycogenin-like starch initiation protein 3 [Perilla frutescens var. hirtella]
MFMSTSAKSLIIRINFIFLAFFLVVYVALLLYPSASDYHRRAASLVRCSLLECHHKNENGIMMKAILEESINVNKLKPRRELIKREKPSFLNNIGYGMKIGMINMDDEDVSEWREHGQIVHVSFEKVPEQFEWKAIFPEWIDEEEEYSGSRCPEIPMPDWEEYALMDMIVVKLPCKKPEVGWNRDVFRLQVHLAAANAAVKKGRWDWKGRMKVVVLSKCPAMVELFRCEEVVKREGEWWLYRPEMWRLEQKVSLPVGSCNLALPLWGKGAINERYDISKIKSMTEKPRKREAYVTVLHSSESYVCGAITLAQSLIRTRTRRDLLLLLDTSISEPKRVALSRAGWSLRFIKRIRNPRAEKDSYNEYNYSKFRLWQLTDYDKLIFIDADIIVLRNIDLLFHFPQMTATGNDAHIFNSGIMVIEPSNCTFRMLMHRRKEIISYNGGDQGYLNEIFVWWHRLPRRVNFLKNFWSNSSIEAAVKNQLFGSEPPKLYSIHYLGLKPWLCYRDYDCNWDIADQHVYASDDAHRRWWQLHDAMPEELQQLCRLSAQRKIELEWNRKIAGQSGALAGNCTDGGIAVARVEIEGIEEEHGDREVGGKKLEMEGKDSTFRVHAAEESGVID